MPLLLLLNEEIDSPSWFLRYVDLGFRFLSYEYLSLLEFKFSLSSLFVLRVYEFLVIVVLHSLLFLLCFFDILFKMVFYHFLQIKQE